MFGAYVLGWHPQSPLGNVFGLRGDTGGGKGGERCRSFDTLVADMLACFFLTGRILTSFRFYSALVRLIDSGREGKRN